MPLRSLIRVAAMYTVRGSLASPICMSTTAPCLYVCPCAACAVVANPGANGSCRRVTRSTGLPRPLSKYHGFRCGGDGKHVIFCHTIHTPRRLSCKTNEYADRQLIPKCVCCPALPLLRYLLISSPQPLLGTPSRFPGRGPNGLWP